MNRLIIFLFISFFIFSNVLHEATAANCDLKERINKAVQDIPLVQEIQQRTRKAVKKVRSAPNKREKKQAIPQLAKNIESFLQKLIPNHNLVQDLMGYVSMPNPNGGRTRH